MDRNRLTINPAGRGKVDILATGTDSRTGNAAGMGFKLSQEEARRMVEDLCRHADLPQPWKRG